MSRLTLILSLALIVGCGDVVETRVSATVRIDGLLADLVASMSIFVLGPKRSDDIFLTCDTLMNRVILPTDSKVDPLARQDIAFSEPDGYSATISDVEAGENRVVYIDASDAGDTVIANGCSEFIEVKSGETTTVDVDVFCLSPPCL
jgi:hypothetical protein